MALILVRFAYDMDMMVIRYHLVIRVADMLACGEYDVGRAAMVDV